MRAGTLAAVVLLAAGFLAATAEAAPRPRLEASSVAAQGGLRVMLVTRTLDFEEMERFDQVSLADEFALAAGEQVDAGKVERKARSQRYAKGGTVFLFASMGLGIFGGIAEAEAETDRLEAVAGPLAARMAAQRNAEQLDHRLARAVIDQLRVRGLAAAGAEPEVVVMPKLDLDREGAVAGFLEDRVGDDPRPLLVVALEQGLPRSAAAVQGMAHLWLWTQSALEVPELGRDGLPVGAPGQDGPSRRADYATHYADGTPRPRPIGKEPGRKTLSARTPHYLGRHAFYALAPVEPEHVLRPPPEQVAREQAAIESEFQQRIADQQDRDLRRQLRVGRDVALRAAERWTPVELAEFMRDAWSAPPGDAYTRLVVAAQEDLARRVVDAVVLPP